MARTTTKTQKSKLEKLRRNSAELHAERKCVPEDHYQSSGEIVFSEMQMRSPKSSEGSKVAEPLTLRNSSKSGGCVSSGGGATVVVGSPIPNTRWSSDQSPDRRSAQRRILDLIRRIRVRRTSNRWIQYNCEEDNGQEPSSNSRNDEVVK
jgi:hypothetical protein